MNKQELIKKYEEEFERIYGFPVIRLSLILEDLKQLDEPQKPVVPQFVANWYEDIKGEFYAVLERLVLNYQNNTDIPICKWFLETEGALTILINMHQFGYTVEKEPKYTVKLKNTDDYLVKTGADDYRFYSNIYTQNRKHTRKELERSGFGWVFNCPGIEVKEAKE